MGLSHRHPPARARREMFQLERGTGMRLARDSQCMPDCRFKNTGGEPGSRDWCF
jgi:hypothetical protein